MRVHRVLYAVLMCAPLAVVAGVAATPEDGARSNAKHVDDRELRPASRTRGGAEQVPAAAAGVSPRGSPVLGSRRVATPRTMGQVARGNASAPRGNVGVARSVPGTRSRGDLARPQSRAFRPTQAANSAALKTGTALKNGAGVANSTTIANGAPAGRSPRVAGAAAAYVPASPNATTRRTVAMSSLRPAANNAMLGGPGATTARPVATLSGPAATTARPTAALGGPAATPGGRSVTFAHRTATLGGPSVGRASSSTLGGMQPRHKL